MSDVSGIPYMGPMGQGNFFAPQFSYNPQLSAGAIQSNYMPEAIQSQNVFNNLYGGGANAGFGRLTDYYSGLGASYSAASGSSNPYGVFSDSGRGGGGGASPYQTSPSVWDTGASPFLGGGGSSGFGGSIYNTPSIDWGGVGQAAAGLQSPSSSSPFDFGAGLGGGMFGGLGGSAAQPGAGQLDWTHLFDGGGARADPAPGMTMPGGLNQPMATPQQQPLDYGSLFGQGVGGTGGAPQPQPYTSGIAPDETGGRTFGERFDALGGSEPMTDPFPGMAMPGGLNSPMTVPAQQQPTDFGSLFGQSVGGTSQPWPADSYNPSQDQPSDPRMDKPLPGNPYTDPEGGGVAAADLSEQARQKLAELMTKPEGAAKPDEAAAAEPGAPFDQPSLAEFQRGRADTVDMSLAGRKDILRNTLGKELTAQGLVVTSDYRAPGHALSQANPGSAHSQGLAFDVRAHTPEQADAAISRIRELLGPRGLVEGRDYRIIDEVRHPSGWATGPHVHTQFTEQGMQKYQQQVYQSPQEGVNRGQDITPPPADIPYPQGVPTPAERPTEAPARPEAAAVPLEARSGVNEGQNITPPPAEIPDPRVSGAGFNALDAAANAPVKHSGLELARANIDTPIEKIAMERGGQKAVDQIPYMAQGKTPRELMNSYGGMFMNSAEPLFKSLNITRQDFEKAIAMPPTRQDLKMRFAGGEDFGPFAAAQGGEQLPAGVKRLPNGDIVASNYWQAPKEGTPEWNQQVYEPMAGSMIMRRPENQTVGGASSYNDFRRSGDVEDRRNEQLGRDQLAALKATPAHYYADPEPASAASNPLALALGLGDLPMPRGMAAASVRPQGVAGDPFSGADAMPGMQDLLGYTPREWPDSAYSQGNDDGGGTFAPFQRPEEFTPMPGTAKEYSIFDMPPGELNPYTGQAGPDPAFRYTSPYSYGGGIGGGFAEDQQVDQQKAEGELQFQRAPMLSQLEDNEDKRNKLFATALDEMGTGASDQAYAAVIESLFNRAAAAGNFDELDKATFLGGTKNKEKYYEGQQVSGGPEAVGTGSKYAGKLDIVRNDPALQARLWEIVKQVAAGSNVSNFATDNASANVARNALARLATQGESLTTRSPDYGKTEGESFFRKDNPMNTTPAENFIGGSPQTATRNWYQNLVPSMRYPPY